MMALFYSSVPVSQQELYQDPETEAAKWNSAIIDFIIYACAFPTVTWQYLGKTLLRIFPILIYIL